MAQENLRKPFTLFTEKGTAKSTLAINKCPQICSTVSLFLLLKNSISKNSPPPPFPPFQNWLSLTEF